MSQVFYISSAIAIISTLLAITRYNPIHALLHFIVSLLAVAVIFFTLGAPFVAALEVIIYAGAIMVVFVFVVMMLNAGEAAAERERKWLTPEMWGAPCLFAGILLAELLYLLALPKLRIPQGASVGPRDIGVALYGPYLLGVELASMVLLTGLAGACHLGRRRLKRAKPIEKETVA